MLQSQRALEFFRVWAFLESTALTFTCIGIFADAPLFVAAAGGMFFCITVIGVWMQVVRPVVALATAVSLGIGAIFVHEPWYYGSVGAMALLCLANMPQNLLLLVSSDSMIAKQIAKLQRKSRNT